MISQQDQHYYLAVARRAVGEAAELVRTQAPGKLTDKGDRDPASEVDLAVERFVRDFLHNKTPEIAFLGEEEGGHPTGNGPLWLLDPIDGTVNFLHGVPLCAVSLSLCDANTAVVAVVDLPFLGTQYAALVGQGAYADGKRLRASQPRRLPMLLSRSTSTPLGRTRSARTAGVCASPNGSPTTRSGSGCSGPPRSTSSGPPRVGWMPASSSATSRGTPAPAS